MIDVLSAMKQGAQALCADGVSASLLWVTLTLASYLLALGLYRRAKSHPLLLPVLTGTALVVTLLWGLDTSYEAYLKAMTPLTFAIGPATVALAIPLFKQLARLKRVWLPASVALLVGGSFAMVLAVGIAWYFGADEQMLVSLAPKSTTMPIATGLSAQHGGLPSLTAVAVAVTGIAATVLSKPLLGLVLAEADDAVTGFALGLSAHAIGTAQALQINEEAGGFAALAMGLNGLFTALLMVGWPFPPLVHR